MKGRLGLALVLSFAGGVLLTAAVGGALGVFDRGPTELDVSDARERGREEATAEVGVGKEAAAAEQAESGLSARPENPQKWLSLDRLPNPDGWFAGVMAGRVKLQERADEAFQSGFAAGERQGRDEALGALRSSDER